jgi:hypothetical protein
MTAVLPQAEAPKLKGEAPPRLVKHPAEDRHCLPSPEQRLTIVDHRPHFIPDVL